MLVNDEPLRCHRPARPGDPVNTDRAYWIARSSRAMTSIGLNALGSPVRSGGPYAEERRQKETEVQELRRQGHPQEGGQGSAVPALQRDRDQAVSRVRPMRDQTEDVGNDLLPLFG